MIKNINLKNYIKFSVTIVLLGLLFYSINWELFTATVRNTNLLILLSLIFLWFLTTPLKSIRWNLILAGYGIKETTKRTFLLYWVGSFFNNFLPSSVGGDSYKFLSLNKIWPGRKAIIASSLALDRTLGMLVMIPFPILVGWNILGLNRQLDMIYWGYCIVVIVSPLLGAITWLAAKRFSNYRFSKARFSILSKVGFVIETFFSYRDKSGLVFSVIISIVLFLLSCLFYQICFTAFNELIAFSHIIFIFPILTIASALPITINGIGLKEGLSVFLFSILGVSLEVALAVSLTTRILLIIATASGGIGYLFMRPRNVSDLDNDVPRKID